MKHLQISIPEGYEIDKAQSTFENIVFKPRAIALPKTWKELNKIDGYFVHSGNSIVEHKNNLVAIQCNKNVFATEEQAKACIALAQLSQLMQVYNDGWVPDWTDGDWKYTIECYECNIRVEERSGFSTFLAFKTKQLAALFLQNFKDLITIAKPLL